MLSDDEFQKYVEDLTSEDVLDAIYIVTQLAVNPVDDPRLLPYLETLCDDHRLALLGAPYSYSNVRRYAAEALAAMRGLLGIDEPVIVKGVFFAVSQRTLGELIRQAGIEYSSKPNHVGALEDLQTLLDMGLFPVKDITWHPREYYQGLLDRRQERRELEEKKAKTDKLD